MAIPRASIGDSGADAGDQEGPDNPREFHLYKLDELDVATDDSLIWFGRSWATNLEIGSRLYFPGERNRWEAWVSLKFTGETWGGEGEDLIVCDRVILVRQTD